MQQEFQAAFASISAIATIAKGILGANTQLKTQEVAVELQGLILDLQSKMASVQADYQRVLRASEDLKAQLLAYEKWEQEKTKYQLENVGAGSFVYSLIQPSSPPNEPPHWICSHCYQGRQKSILQRTDKLSHYVCPRCHTEITVLKKYPSANLVV